MIKVVVIEDEIVSSDYLVALIKKYCSDKFVVVNEIDNVIEAINWFNSNDNVDLIFMDIQLSDGNCFDILCNVNIDCPIIFTTAYDIYTKNAFKSNGIDYLLKPISEKDFYHAIMKFLNLRESKDNQIIKQLK